MKIKMVPEKKGKPIEEAYREFVTYCRARNLTEATLTYYDESFYRFLAFYKGSTKEITPKLVEEYMILLKNGMKEVSVNTYLRGLRAILYYFMRLGYTEEFKITLAKAGSEVKETYTEEEIKILLRPPDVKKCTFAEYRTWAVINFLLGTGCRLSSVTKLLVKDVKFDEGFIILRHTKNRSQSMIPLAESLARVLREYLRIRGGEEDDYLFCNEFGKELTTSAMKTALYKYNRRRGVVKTSIHLFRHTFAKTYIKNGGDVFRLQKILGHKSLDMVREYVNMYSEDLKDNYGKLNPLDLVSNTRIKF